MSAPGTAEPELEVSTLAEVQVELDKNSEEIQEAELQVQVRDTPGRNPLSSMQAPLDRRPRRRVSRVNNTAST